jgi:hypothetical protein
MRECGQDHQTLLLGSHPIKKLVIAGTVRATAGALALADRMSDTWIDQKRVNDIELLAGRAALSALVSSCTLCEQKVDSEGGRSVWAD